MEELKHRASIAVKYFKLSKKKKTNDFVLESCPNFLEYSSKAPKYIPYDDKFAYFDDLKCVV